MIETFPVYELEIDSLIYPSIFKPHCAPYPEAKPRFGVAWEWHGEKVRASSVLAPTVTEVNSNYLALLAVFQEAELRNIPRDMLFRGVRATLTLQNYTATRSAFGRAITDEYRGLVGVTIDADDLRCALDSHIKRRTT